MAMICEAGNVPEFPSEELPDELELPNELELPDEFELPKLLLLLELLKLPELKGSCSKEEDDDGTIPWPNPPPPAEVES
jgi:hypothetical protein